VFVISAQLTAPSLPKHFVEDENYDSLLGRDPLPMMNYGQQRLFTYDREYINPTTEYRLDCIWPTR